MTLSEQFQEIQERMYLDWFNNYLTVDTFAKAYNIEITIANIIINKGREMHNNKYSGIYN